MDCRIKSIRSGEDEKKDRLIVRLGSGLSNIAIVGGGIGGLTAALALLREGIDVDVYEQAAWSEPPRRCGDRRRMRSDSTTTVWRMQPAPATSWRANGSRSGSRNDTTGFSP